MKECLFCKKRKFNTLIDLKSSFVANNLKNEQRKKYSLKVVCCKYCRLFQLDKLLSSKLLFNSNYPYLSSTSKSWLNHSRIYVEKMTKIMKLNKKSKVLEIASNDGYLLNFFKKKGINVLGVEPSKSVALIAKKKGINTIIKFFGLKTALKLSKLNYEADLIVLKNVLAHVPNINDFVSGLPLVLKKNGQITIEFPHVLELIKKNQFDTIYHEHFTYLSITFLVKLFHKHNLKIHDVEKLKTHGGSLRIYVSHLSQKFKTSNRVNKIILEEKNFKLHSNKTFKLFQKRVSETKKNFHTFLNYAKKNRKKILGYAAAAKSITFLSYMNYHDGILKYVIDKNKLKISKKIPGTKIIIKDEKFIKKYKPDYIILFAWNLKKEVFSQLNYIKTWNSKFLTFVPKFKMF